MRNIKLFIIGLVLLFISAISAEDITLYHITPCIILPWVVYISIKLEYKYCLTYTFFISLANDLLNPQLLGFSTILFILLSHFTHKYNSSFNKDKYSTILFSLLVINALYFSIQWVYFSITSPEPLYLLGKTMITILYSTMISCLVLFIVFLIDKLRIYIYDQE